ncbi:MAG TPA: MerR family transcriptional regulator [Anaerolineaceae bacterium]|nr:MerR family transcriptional regulator [Anaerolineaceae bacterium]HQP07857.1 MerR family transcriptional regulator [Anaerolineaceae bacterium]
MNATYDQNFHTPVYNIKAISLLADLPAVTLLAWERRYGLLRPQRGEQGYRLYSEYDLYTVRWLKAQIKKGLTISRATEFLSSLRMSGNDPVISQPLTAFVKFNSKKAAQKFYQYLLKMDSLKAGDLLEKAYEETSAEEIFDGIISPALKETGEAWHFGELPVAVEHHASQLIMQKLHRWTGQVGRVRQDALIMAACAPNEHHQIGILMLVLLLRLRGWDARFFGTDLAMDGIGYTFNLLQPRLVLLSATMPDNAENLTGLFKDLEAVPEPKPVIVLGGKRISQQTHSRSIAWHYHRSADQASGRLDRGNTELLGYR